MCSASTSHPLAIGTLNDGCMGELAAQQQGEPLLRTQAPGGAVIRSKYRGLSWDKKHQGWVLVRFPPKKGSHHQLALEVTSPNAYLCTLFCRWRVRIYFSGKQRHVGACLDLQDKTAVVT